MNLNKLKTVEKIMESSFPTALLERLVHLDEKIIALEQLAESKSDDDDAQVAVVQDILQYAGAVITEFREVWAVYDDPEPEVSEVEQSMIDGTAGDNDGVDCGVMDCDKEDHSECEEEVDEAVSNKDD